MIESTLQENLDALASRKAPADAAKTDASNALFTMGACGHAERECEQQQTAQARGPARLKSDKQ